ncbi:MAG: DUF327 family protein [Spirochaetota bacterium]|nr:DUF327 family protein [Spirochaetota bacterium]
MINITSTNPKKNENTKIKTKKHSQQIKHKEATFKSALQSTFSSNFQGTIEDLLNDLREEEKRFIDNQSLNNLERYKGIVQQILKKILDKGFDTKTLRSCKRDRADFIIVQEINSQLIQISSAITHRTNSAFNLLKKIEEVRGLIFDLLY